MRSRFAPILAGHSLGVRSIGRSTPGGQRPRCRWCSTDDAEFSWYPAVLRELLVGAAEPDRIAATCRGTGDRPVLRQVAETLREGVGPGGRVVDLGAGAGGPAAWLQRTCSGLSFEAVEPAREAVRCARALFPGLEVHRGDILDPPGEVRRDAAAALVLGVLSTVTERRLALAQARRLVRPDGLLILTDFVERQRAGAEPLTLPGGAPAFTRRQLRRDLAAAGWRILSIGDDIAADDPQWARIRRSLDIRIRDHVAGTPHGLRSACPTALAREAANRRRFRDLIGQGVLGRVFLVAEAGTTAA